GVHAPRVGQFVGDHPGVVVALVRVLDVGRVTLVTLVALVSLLSLVAWVALLPRRSVLAVLSVLAVFAVLAVLRRALLQHGQAQRDGQLVELRDLGLSLGLCGPVRLATGRSFGLRLL